MMRGDRERESRTVAALAAASIAIAALWRVGCASPESPAEGDRSTRNDGPAATEPHRPCRPSLEPLPPSGEGMWPWADLAALDGAALEKRGLELPLADLWTPESGGLLRAAVGLKGCSASFVSPDGLLVTNHHCAYRAIQRNSTPEHNLVEEGFVARSRSDELDGHGVRVLVFARQTDVTEEVLDGLAEGASDLERIRHIESREKDLVARCEEKPDARCRVSRNNEGLSFVLLENLEIRDVRLVAAPPRSLGEFGGEVDNWHWPRHTMDFALLRAYVSPDGSPADHSPENRPYRTERHFQIGADGVSPGDLVMVAGTPYSTRRYLPSAAVREHLEWYYPLRKDLFSEWIEVLDGACRDMPKSCLPTSSSRKSLSNALINARGMIEGLERAGILERKQREEAAWREWVSADPGRAARWGSALDDLEEHVEQSREGRDRDFLFKYLLWGNRIAGFGRKIAKWAAEQEKEDADREPGWQERDREDLLDDLRQSQRSLHLGADRRVLAILLARFAALDEAERPRAFDEALGGDWSPGSVDRFLDRLYGGTRLGDEEVRAGLFGADLRTLGMSGDTAIRLALALAPEIDEYEERAKTREGALSRLGPPYVESIIAMRRSRFYPDANATPRVSFATVAGYSPRDGVWHTPMTTLSGLAAKATGERPFDAPPEVLAAIRAKDLGARADRLLGDVPVCFLSNADTTGGNSGSPVLDASGRLVGLNFDRVYENIAGDYGYDPRRSRNISVEIRSVLWYLDRVLGARRLLEEMGAAPP